MTRYDVRVRWFAVCLSALAGYVDAIGFVTLNGFFVSFMSGNSTRFALGLSAGSRAAAVAGGLIALFLLGVVLGSLVGRRSGDRRRPVVVLGVAVLLAGAATTASFGETGLAMALAAIAMGFENAVFERDGDVHIGLTYMTGALVKLGQRLAAALSGEDRWGWVPYATLWGGLTVGAVVGALAYGAVGLGALWFAAAWAAAFAVIATRL